MKFRERYLTFSIGVLSLVLISAWSFPIIHPSGWGDLSIAAGLRPPADVFHGFSRGILTLLHALLPPDFVLPAAQWLGRAAVAWAVAGVYVVFRGFLPYVMNADEPGLRVVLPVSRGIAAMTAMLFLCIDPVWRAGQLLTSVTVQVVLGVFAAVCLMRFLLAGRLGALYLCFLSLGALSSDSFLGLVLTFAAVIWLKVSTMRNERLAELSEESVWSTLFRRLLKLWLLAWIVGSGVGVLVFVRSGGAEAVGSPDAVEFALSHVKCLRHVVVSLAGFPGWAYGLLVCLLPFVVACGMVRQAYDKEIALPYAVEAMAVLISLVSLVQVVAMTPLMAWCHIRQTTLVHSDSLLAFFLTFSLAALALSLAVFGVDIHCRNYGRIVRWRLRELGEPQVSSGIASSLRQERDIRRYMFWAVLVLLPCLALSGRYQGVAREVAGLAARYVREIVRECKGRRVVFTDGAFDPLIELCAHAQGDELVAVSTVAPNTPYERAVRSRAVETDEDKALLANDGITALRTWIETGDSNRLAQCASLVGGVFWKRQKVAMPPVSGLVVVPGAEASSAEIARGRAEADALAEAVLDFCRRNPSLNLDDLRLQRLFPFLQWRLAQNSRLRAYGDALGGRCDESVKSTEIAERLDDANASLAELNKHAIWRNVQNGGVLTPREVLALGLARADFKLAAIFARPVLRTDPDDVRANFAMGMKHYLAEEWAMSERYFQRCLRRRPDEPSVLNNLANAQARLGKFEEAEANVAKALERMPNSPEILKSQSKIKELAKLAKKSKG